ncbi:hypothetical protein [Petrachloros mirabilis]
MFAKTVRRILRLAAFILILNCLTGCASIGPKTMISDRFDYVGTIGESWKQQMLLNIVKIRYGDAPVFLDVASIISGYTLETGVNITGQIASPGKGDVYGNIGAHGTLTDRPTITYAPLGGEKFARSLMRPIPPTAVLGLVQSGYPIDLVLRVCVQSVNSVRNEYSSSLRPRPADPEFYPLLERLLRIQDSGSIGIRIKQEKGMEGVMLSLRGKAEKSIEEDISFVRRTLGLDPASWQFSVDYGAVAKDNREIAILTRSILEILVDMAGNIEVPSDHVREKRVNPTMTITEAQGAPIVPIVKIYSSTARPGDSFVAVPYRDYWFWIDDRDYQSKKLFSFLMFIFSLTETGGKEGTPIITVPAG